MFIFLREAWSSMVGFRAAAVPLERHIPLFSRKVRSIGLGIVTCSHANSGLSLFATLQMLPDSHSDAHSLLCARQTHRLTVRPSAFAGSSQSLGPAFGRWAHSH